MEVTIPSGGGPVGAYLSVPQPDVVGTGPWPGVVVVHDIFGVSDDFRAIADRFATGGYLAVVPDLYSGGGFVHCMRSTMRQLQAGSGAAFDAIDASRRWLVDRADCTGRIGVAGFCMGGGFALLAAARGFDVSAPYYGALPADDAALDDACPIVASYGRRDPALRGAAARLERLLTERRIAHDVKEYPGVGHAFANRLPVGPLGPLLRVTGLGYHHPSAEDAWRRVLAFFAAQLRAQT